MKFLGFKERSYQDKHLNEVRHVTLDPAGPGVVRLHLVPPKPGRLIAHPSVLIVNGQDFLPVSFSWAVLMSCFIDAIEPYEGREILPADWDSVVLATLAGLRQVYPRLPEETVRRDLTTIIGTLVDVAAGRKPEAEIGLLSLGEYARHMKAPHRMDLMVSAMSKGGRWNCNQQCLHCYAAGQPLAAVPELSTREWLDIIGKCREAGIPQLTFTGGEPTLRADLVELIAAARWFVTRLNTNGVLLTDELCRQLYQASLDSMQITFYSDDSAIHNLLVGSDNWQQTVDGIKSAVKSGLNVSINTPLCSDNRNYTKTLRFLKELGIQFLSCSGLIPAGQALQPKSAETKLNPDELLSILAEANSFAMTNGMDLAFTSPGWLPADSLHQIGLRSAPACGACLSNMAVTPDGRVVPCQSWLGEEPLGNMLTDQWPEIWNNRVCQKIRNQSALMENRCQLQSNQTQARKGDSK